jgi:hypothetical protein
MDSKIAISVGVFYKPAGSASMIWWLKWRYSLREGNDSPTSQQWQKYIWKIPSS